MISEIFPERKINNNTGSIKSLQKFIEVFENYLPYHYKNQIIRSSIWLLKYKGHAGIANIYAQVLSEEVFETIVDLYWWNNIQNILVIPMPNSAQRRKQRGWNQTELIVQSISKYISLNSILISLDILIKKQHTISQTKFKRQERLQNIQNSFYISDISDIIGETIILFDDVTTTGATLTEATYTLYCAGAKQIIPITLAH